MNKLLFLLLCCVFVHVSAFGHDGHQSVATEVEGREPSSWIEWIGSFHLIFLHFPIALINMLAVSEALFALYKKPIFEFSARFLMISSALLSLPTALLGLIYSYFSTYSGLMELFLYLHMTFGISTAILAIVLPFIREKYGLGKVYYTFLILLLLIVNTTGFFGGGMTFGPYHMNPPL